MAEPGMAHMGTELRMVVRGESRTHRFLRSRLMFLFLATVALDALATVLMYTFEHDARGHGVPRHRRRAVLGLGPAHDRELPDAQSGHDRRPGARHRARGGRSPPSPRWPARWARSSTPGTSSRRAAASPPGAGVPPGGHGGLAPAPAPAAR